MTGMNQFDRLETLAQSLIEGVFTWLFKARTHSADVAHHLASASADRLARRWKLWSEGRQFDLGGPVVRIGRALDNDIILKDSTVFYYHAQLRWRDGRYHLYPPETAVRKRESSPILVDTGQWASNSLVNGRPANFYPLEAGDIVTLGRTMLTVVVAPSGS